MPLGNRFSLLFASVLCLGALPAWSADQSPAAWTLGAARAPSTLSSPAAVRAVTVHLRQQAFDGTASVLHLDVFGRQYQFVDGRKSAASPERYSWTGHLLGQPDFQAQLSV
ncbi:MAG: hypothetical protein KDI60_21445, partial [Xanthomonadales bacterium]|nr:hypothetical protein [Xanthomonadales bacterium]